MSLDFVAVFLCGALNFVVPELIVNSVLDFIGQVLLFNVMIRVIVRIKVMLTLYLCVCAIAVLILQMSWEIARFSCFNVSQSGGYCKIAAV